MIIPARFNGPPGSGNGGYSAGLLAAELGPALFSGAEVTLRRPPPLDTELTIRPREDGSLGAFAGEELIAYGQAIEVEDEPADAASLDDAAEAAKAYHGFTAHPFPTCYVCGPQRPDGLRIFPGRLDTSHTAAPFVVPDDVSPAVMWAALDCPGGWAVPLEERAYVLGRIAARVDALAEPGTHCVAVGQIMSEDGRKAHVRSALYGPAGALLARARATWIALT
jgi:hypothetical protein